jgi:hypothetical protein
MNVEPEVEHVVDPQGTGESGPDLCVLSMAANGRRLPLPVQKRGYRGMGPGKGVLAVADHLERLVPSVVADHRADPEQYQEEALVEEHAIGSDRVHLQAPWLDTVGGPAWHVILPPKLARDPGPVRVGVVGSIGIMAELR